jgi:hypothetical protein
MEMTEKKQPGRYPERGDKEDLRCGLWANGCERLVAVSAEDWCEMCGLYVCRPCNTEFPEGAHDVLDHSDQEDTEG